jgi:hypothetical protein
MRNSPTVDVGRLLNRMRGSRIEADIRRGWLNAENNSPLKGRSEKYIDG